MAKRNPGWFRRGHDPRRHRLTHEERTRGGITRGRQIINEMHVHIYGWPLLDDEQEPPRVAARRDALFNNTPLPH